MVLPRKSSAFILAVFITVSAVYHGECLGRTPFKERIHFNIGAGWGNYDMKRGEVRIIPPDDYVYLEYSLKRIDGGREFYGEILFISAGLMFRLF